MIPAHGYAAPSATGAFKPFNFERRDVGARDVLIDILYCGICHSDIHTVRDEWGGAHYPLVPGHEILGRVARVGARVTRFKVGDTAGVGCFVSSCGKCPACKSGDQQYCPQAVFTYGSADPDTRQPTRGGYSDRIVVNENYVLRIPDGQPLERVAPLLCAGITTYYPLKRAGLKRGMKVGIVGLGGLGHVAVKIARAMGAEVTVFSRSAGKKRDALRLGAAQVVVTNRPRAFAAAHRTLDFILDTVSGQHDLVPYLNCLKRDREMILVGAPEKPHALPAFSLIMARQKIGGTLIGGIADTQEMLNFCARKKVLADVEVIAPSKINVAYDRTVAGDVKYRFVIDLGRR